MLFLLIPLFLACGHAAKEKAKELQARNDSLVNQTVQKDEAINDFIRSVNDIQGTLDTIKMKENIINLSTGKSGELKVSAKEQIKDDIMTIYNLMLKNKKELASLTSKLKASGMKIAELEKLVSHLKKDISDKNIEIETLRDKLAKLNINIEAANLRLDTLTNVIKEQGQQLNQQSQVISRQDAALNTAYYIIGTEKELKKNKIIGSGDKIIPDFNKSLFTKIDIRKTLEIPVLSKKAKILSNHPTTAYKFNGDKKMIQALQILDYKAFWINSRYLIIVVN
jgi:chromosome segregation ATPase